MGMMIVASGCILGECPVCNELVWEDEWDMAGEVIVHSFCKRKYRNNQPTRPVADDILTKTEIQNLKEILEYCTERIDFLEKQVRRLQYDNPLREKQNP